ncbi:MAG: hypothetical protein IKI49_05410 [Oscillospiraceae bacterium]|nr:hypothetical protein [Oscillospiraceae bacterium]
MNRWLVSLISLIVSIIFAAACFYLPNTINLFWAIVIAVLIFIISFVFIELLEHTKRIKDYDTNAKFIQLKRAGITEYHNDFTEIDFAKCIRSAKHVRIVLLYSKNTISNNISSLRRFVERNSTSLEIIILKNDSDCPAFKYIASKFGYSDTQLSEKLGEFKDAIKRDLLPYKGKKSSIKLYCTDIIPMYTLFLFDKYAYVTLYKTTPQRTNLIPCFRIEKTNNDSFYLFASQDFEELKGRSTEVSL